MMRSKKEIFEDWSYNGADFKYLALELLLDIRDQLTKLNSKSN